MIADFAPPSTASDQVWSSGLLSAGASNYPALSQKKTFEVESAVAIIEWEKSKSSGGSRNVMTSVEPGVSNASWR